jgi:hypothetical protein
MANAHPLKIRKIYLYWLAIFLVASTSCLGQKATTATNDLTRKFRLLRDTTRWQSRAAIPLDFPAHHPQGMVKIGPHFYLSSVEVLDRAAGRGVGHLFKFNEKGDLLADLKVGEGAIYHPGGIDYDGEFIWVPVAEYRPDSRSIVYKVDPATLAVTEVLRFGDHLGGIVHDTQSITLHAISWGSRTYYDWPLSKEKVPSQPGPVRKTLNPSFYIDYQDCHYTGDHLMLCGGLKSYPNGSTTFRLGGLELVDLSTHQPVHQVPLKLYAPSGRPITQNPFWLESTPTGLRAYFVPDDDKATLFVYDVFL